MTRFLSRTLLLPVAALLWASAALLAGCDVTIEIGDQNPSGNSIAEAAEDAGAWAWVPVEGARCRDGSSTGFGVRLRESSARLFIYLEGGGACFNGATCQGNRKSFGRTAFSAVTASGRAGSGLLNAENSENPVAEWHTAYVPYCTGDVHAGSARDVRVEGVDADSNGTADAQQFVGHRNVERYLDLLAGRLGDTVDHVLLAGSSAGGFGALFNYEAARAAFPDARVTLLDDSGPLVADDEVLAPSLEAHWIDLWGLNGALSAPARTAVEDEGLAGIYSYYTGRYPDASFGLLSSLEDATIRDFYGYRQPGCEAPEECVSGNAYARALANVRDQHAPAWNTYYIPGAAHTFLTEDAFYEISVSGMPMAAWTDALLSGNVQDVAP